jgi:hypothetical protein
MQLMETDTFNLHCFLAPTGTKFFVTSAPRTPAVEQLLRTVYELYSDYVLKNPFYEVRLPPRRVLFVPAPGGGRLALRLPFERSPHGRRGGVGARGVGELVPTW